MSVETHSAVMSAMRSGNAQPPFYQRLLDEYADRAEKAHSVEIDALTEKLNTAKHCLKVWSDRADELRRKFDEQYAELKRERGATCNALNTKTAENVNSENVVYNGGKMHEALNAVLGLFDSGLVVYSDSCDHSDTAQIQYVLDKTDAALSEPPRNCDIGTAEEQEERLFSGIDDKGVEIGLKFVREIVSEVLTWGQMPYTKGASDEQ